MDQRDNVLYDVLLKNAEETQKWLSYKTDHEDAMKNLEAFRKKMSIEVMVPIGSKALMPGKLVHTNEILISHFGKMFSKCSSNQAQEICKKRIQTAVDYLQKLENEKDMFLNKLDLPHKYGALPEAEQREIIEEYDEDKEKLWREEHKKRIRAEKLNEIEKSNEEKEKSHDEIMQRLEELELMDELETELEQLGIEDDDTLNRLMSGEINVTEKTRVSHFSEKNESSESSSSKIEIKESPTEKLISKFKTVKISELEHNASFTNNNTIPNNEDFNISRSTDSDELSDSSLESLDPEEFIAIRKEAEEIETYKKKINFVMKKIKMIEREIDTMKVSNPSDLDIKLNKIEVRDYLLDYAFTLEDENTLEKQVELNDIDNKSIENDLEIKIKKGKRITFALKDDIRYIDSVQNIQNNKYEQLQRDKIELDPQYQFNNTTNVDSKNFDTKDTNLSIIDKVERNLEYVHEKQSHEDFDLVSKIINSNNMSNNTLEIKFKHSSSTYQHNENKDFTNNSIDSPADFYYMFGEEYPQNIKTSMQCENEKKIEIIAHLNSNPTQNNDLENKQQEIKQKESDSNDYSETVCEPKIQIPTILKNKEAVQQESHYVNVQQESPFENNTQKSKSNKKPKKEKEEEITKMTLGDVVENPIPEKPDDLPKCNFVDAHAPKKRISKFKQSRSMTT